MKISKILSAVIIGLGLNGSLYANTKLCEVFGGECISAKVLAIKTAEGEEIKAQIEQYANSIANNPTYSGLKELGEALTMWYRADQYSKDYYNRTDLDPDWNMYRTYALKYLKDLFSPGLKFGDTLVSLSDRNLGIGSVEFDTTASGLDIVTSAQEIFANAIKELEALEKSSINNTIEALRPNTNINSIISLSKNALDARAIALLNPNNSSNIALAAAIKNLEGLEFASCDNYQALACVVQEYTKRFETTNNLWANVLGAKAYLKNSPDTDIYGFILGYDHAFDSDILGAFISFAKAKSDGNNITNESDNYQFGIYSKSFFGNSELDSKIYYGFSKSDYSRSVLNMVYSADYDSDFMGIELEYGYVFDINSLFVKPLVGLGYSYIRTNDFNERGDLTLHYNKTTNKNAMAKIGVELRKYYDEYSYFYIKPAIERDIYKSGTDSVANFIGSEYSIINQNDEKKHTYISGSLGAEVSLNEAFSINANIGAKLRSDEKIYNGTFGVKYKF